MPKLNGKIVGLNVVVTVFGVPVRIEGDVEIIPAVFDMAERDKTKPSTSTTERR